MTAPVPVERSLMAITEQCELKKADLPAPYCYGQSNGNGQSHQQRANFPITSAATTT
ncbi:MAG: hypothetical protein OXH57_09825 [Ekhidna sp.]|nr:hypothetical protein [Ekhidna sp.]